MTIRGTVNAPSPETAAAVKSANKNRERLNMGVFFDPIAHLLERQAQFQTLFSALAGSNGPPGSRFRTSRNSPADCGACSVSIVVGSPNVPHDATGVLPRSPRPDRSSRWQRLTPSPTRSHNSSEPAHTKEAYRLDHTTEPGGRDSLNDPLRNNANGNTDFEAHGRVSDLTTTGSG